MDYKEFLETFGEEIVSFSSYYKFTFIFNNDKISVGIGGDKDDIYRLNIDNEPIKIKNLDDIIWVQIGENLINFNY